MDEKVSTESVPVQRFDPTWGGVIDADSGQFLPQFQLPTELPDTPEADLWSALVDMFDPFACKRPYLVELHQKAPNEASRRYIERIATHRGVKLEVESGE
ncbi:hypothetical protein E2P84_36690 [Burkholderia cepacia]|uniref:Uncharacterized protein n=1 Tax=Burkholderia cepacia TaxID=292 RepID=A0AAX2RQN1_BURCE|nr:hypothetical protein [Burkholderia cepacia]TES65669.1 hypothetical protein E2P84_36690 [Burkholderia cepacia]TET01675.1 hypothetical protein E3D36_16705 [Burkholderia cepacia]TEU47533.1 hypothetical protein E3D37_16135 [Burkholderia cepacia]TEU53560.1 hypothetical protein E3D38_12525 [Burkholderia cepacia]TEV02166.1 hypothetical protein E3D40_13455 [Burkholderia cepacia]